MSLLNNYICALDIGSSKIAAAVAQIRRGRVTGIFFETLPSAGIKRGAIADSIGLTNTVGTVLKNLKNRSGINIKAVYTNISGQDIVTKHSRAIMPLAERGNKVITVSDIQRINEQARILGSSLEEEIIYQIPCGYTIDSRSNVLNPLGLYSHRLEVDLYLICARLSSLQSLTRAINQAGYEARDIFFSGTATSAALLNSELKEGITVLCDIGSDITELLLFRDGLLQHAEIIFTGGNDLTWQISEQLKIPLDLAEEIKKTYGTIGDYGRITEDKEVLVKKKDVYRPIKQKVISEIITVKTNSVCQEIKESVAKIILPDEINNFVSTGRAVLLDGFMETLENTLGIPVKLGRIASPDLAGVADKGDFTSGHKYLNYITALGQVSLALSGQQHKIPYLPQPTRNPILKTIDRFKELYQEYF